MSECTLVSIIIDNYNYGRFLRSAIDSALTQTYPHVEVIVVDDGSTDDSQQVIGEYNQRITAILKQNGGQASAFNQGFEASTGDIIVFLDSDDLLLPTAIEKAVAGFDGPEVAKVHWPLWKINEHGEKTGDVVPPHPLAEGDLLDRLMQTGPAYFCGTAYGAPTSGNAWSRQFLSHVFPLPEAQFKTGGGDFFLSVLAPVYGVVQRLAEPQSLYRVHGKNDTLKAPDAYMETFFGWFEQASLALHHNLDKRGLVADTHNWKRDSWYHQIQASIQDITNFVPAKERFILVDGNDWGTTELVAGRYRIQLIEHDGQYWGPPADDARAIQEIEKQRERGVNFIFFASQTFWWLEYYTDMYSYLKTNYNCIINNDRLIGFHLELTMDLNKIGALSITTEM